MHLLVRSNKCGCDLENFNHIVLIDHHNWVTVHGVQSTWDRIQLQLLWAFVHNLSPYLTWAASSANAVAQSETPLVSFWEQKGWVTKNKDSALKNQRGRKSSTCSVIFTLQSASLYENGMWFESREWNLIASKLQLSWEYLLTFVDILNLPQYVSIIPKQANHQCSNVIF